jgi:hypothetical protein
LGLDYQAVYLRDYLSKCLTLFGKQCQIVKKYQGKLVCTKVIVAKHNMQDLLLIIISDHKIIVHIAHLIENVVREKKCECSHMYYDRWKKRN